jgi:hypothetical protein
MLIPFFLTYIFVTIWRHYQDLRLDFRGKVATIAKGVFSFSLLLPGSALSMAVWVDQNGISWIS